jgi:hypothetical protein
MKLSQVRCQLFSGAVAQVMSDVNSFTRGVSISVTSAAAVGFVKDQTFIDAQVTSDGVAGNIQVALFYTE